MPKIQHRKLKQTKKKSGQEVGVSMAGQVNHVPASGDLHPPIRVARSQKPTTTEVVKSGGESWACTRRWKRSTCWRMQPTLRAVGIGMRGSWCHWKQRTTVVTVERCVVYKNWRRCVDLDWKFSIQKPRQFLQKPQRMKEIAGDFFVDIQESK